MCSAFIFLYKPPHEKCKCIFLILMTFWDYCLYETHEKYHSGYSVNSGDERPMSMLVLGRNDTDPTIVGELSCFLAETVKAIESQERLALLQDKQTDRCGGKIEGKKKLELTTNLNTVWPLNR